MRSSTPVRERNWWGVLKKEGLHHIYIDGGRVIRQFWGRGLLDKMTISVIPIVLGDGIPLLLPR